MTEVTPTTSPARLRSGPPELPGLIGASVWMTSGREQELPVPRARCDRRLRSLYFRLILIFLAVSLAGTLLAAFLIRRSNEQAFERLLREQAQAYFARDLRAYYVATGSWDGIRYLLYAKFSRGPQPQPYALADADGTVIAPAGPWETGETLSRAVLDDGLPITVDGRRVGTVLLLDQEPPRNTFEEHCLAGVNQVLSLGALGATTIAVVLGAVLARTLTRPLGEVADASRADESRQEGHGESGLGLAIARSIVEMHGGTIAVESALERGTTFRIRLPVT